MWSINYWPENYWPGYYWPVTLSLVTGFSRVIRTRRFLKEGWEVTLVNSAGTRYSLGTINQTSDERSLIIPVSVPDGTYSVEVITNGLAWDGLVQKNNGSITIDRTSSVPIDTGTPLLTDLRYDSYMGLLRLKWDGDVSPANSGIVSAGIWLSSSVPDFNTDPTYTIPLFSYQSEHFFLIDYDSLIGYAGIACIDEDSNQTSEQYISIPDRSVIAPSAVAEPG